jgi:hypothetical protein
MDKGELREWQVKMIDKINLGGSHYLCIFIFICQNIDLSLVCMKKERCLVVLKKEQVEISFIAMNSAWFFSCESTTTA